MWFSSTIPGPITRPVKSLGLTTDNTLSFDDLCKAAHFHIRALRHIRQCVSVNDAKAVVCGECVGVISVRLLQLYIVRNVVVKSEQVAARPADPECTVMMTKRREHITPLLRELHWFPITARIQFKIASSIYFDRTSRLINWGPPVATLV